MKSAFQPSRHIQTHGVFTLPALALPPPSQGNRTPPSTQPQAFLRCTPVIRWQQNYFKTSSKLGVCLTSFQIKGVCLEGGVPQSGLLSLFSKPGLHEGSSTRWHPNPVSLTEPWAPEPTSAGPKDNQWTQSISQSQEGCPGAPPPHTPAPMLPHEFRQLQLLRWASVSSPVRSAAGGRG